MAARSSAARVNIPRLRASARPTIPYLGRPEDLFTAAFLNAYGHCRAVMRTTAWADGLQAASELGTESALGYVSQSLASAAAAFSEAILPVYVQVSVAAGRGDMMLKAAGSAEQQPGREAEPLVRPRRRKVKPLLTEPSEVATASRYHIAAAREMGMDLITHITNAQESVIRDIVTEAITQGLDPLVTGDRIADVVGLFPRWQRAVENFHERQLTNGARPDVAARRAARYADNLLRKRGLMIARTELMRAMNLGRLNEWRAEAEDGRLDPEKSIKVWSAAPDACPVCAAMNGKRVVGLNSFFETELGDFDHPPCHPHCRCVMDLAVVR